MQVTFGLRLDERQGPSGQSYFMAPVVGRQGFLGLLEAYLGLAGPDVPKARRVAAYLGHLRSFDDGKRFYSKSLAADDVGTAARLLAWRDEWRLGGWSGDALPTSPRRVRELSAVEQPAAGAISPGEGERLAAVAHALETRAVPVQAVRLVDPLALFPLAWRRVLALLPCEEISSVRELASGQLGAVQRIAQASTAAGFVVEQVTGAPDGSVRVLRALSRETAEHWLSAWCRANVADRLLLCEFAGDSLDATLTATGAPACGFESPSELRPALQALGLGLEMCWAPLDVNPLVEFLVHPIGPFSRSARNTLARALTKQPGLGGEAWADAKVRIAERKGGEKVLAEIEFWLEGERWRRDEGVPIAVLAARTSKIQEALKRRASKEGPESAAIGPALHQCAAVLDGLEELNRQGIPRLVPRQLEQLLAQSTPGGATNPAAVAHVGCWKSATTPANCCVETAEEVIWWMPSTPSLPEALPWSASEVEGLRALAVELRDPARELEAMALQWLRPLLSATKRFTLVLPPPGDEEHPIWQLVREIAPSLPVVRIEGELYTVHRDTVAEVHGDMELAQAERFMALGRPLASRRVRQSYSSLNEFFNNPALAALNDAAKLEPGSALAVEEGNTLLGTLGHRVVEELFSQEGVLGWDLARATGWFDGMVDGFLEAEGAPLLVQGAGVTLHRFKETCRFAIGALLQHLKSAGATRVHTELSVEGDFGAVPLTGDLDLVVELPRGRLAVLDLKWTKTKRYAERLQAGKHLQLAFYAGLVKEKFGSLPAVVGYFIFDTGTLLVTTPDIFPRAQLHAPTSGITLTQLLDQARKTYAWRAAQWEEGIVELVDDALVEDASDYQGPEGTLAIESLGPWHQEHLTLLGGWEQ